jgi:serine phosphatase RsbU (regulator of sigma subunit)
MPRPTPIRLLLALGLLAFLVAGLSIVDMFLPRPYDGVVLEPDSPYELKVQKVVPGSGAAVAGVRPGDLIIGIDRSALYSPSAAKSISRDLGERTPLRRAAELVAGHRIGDHIAYLVRRGGREAAGGAASLPSSATRSAPERQVGERLLEVDVVLGRRTIASPAYVFACLLGFGFFFVGLFVLLRQQRAGAAWVFHTMSSLFMLFLVCRLRPASYSWVDSFVLTTGTAALIFLPATFLHFFLVFPRPFHLSREGRAVPFGLTRQAWAGWLAALYLVPVVVYGSARLPTGDAGRQQLLISGAPAANWWVLALYLIAGLLAISLHSRAVPDPRQRRGAALVSIGAIFGLVPFIVLAVVFPSFLHTEDFLFLGVLPLALVPATFAYAIVRYELLDIRVIVRKSLLYTATSALVTAFYALGIAFFNALFRETRLASSAFFPVVLALAIVVLFEPLRRRIQGPIDRFFFAERLRLERAMEEMGEAFTARVDLTAVVRDLVERLPTVLGVDFAALYLRRGEQLERTAGPGSLPARLPVVGALHERLLATGGLSRVEELPYGSATGGNAGLESLTQALAAAGVELVGDLVSRGQSVGVILLSGKNGGALRLEPEEARLLSGLLHQAAVALDTSLLVAERTRQAELERELEIAASIQQALLPPSLSTSPGWKVAAHCQPARHVGGDFYLELPMADGRRAIAYADVSGKSVSGALMMMAAHEVLYSLAMSGHPPARLLDLANERLYRLGKRSFVALGMLSFDEHDPLVHYALAGQPQPLRRGRDGEVTELALPAHRLPLGALLAGAYEMQTTPVRAGEMLLAYSDGVIEALSPSDEVFGIERLTALLASVPPEPQVVVESVLSALADFTAGREPYDDVTLVAICRQQETMHA